MYYHNESKIYEELKFLKSKNVKKINIIDPTFNIGKNYNNILKMLLELDIKSKISIQTRLRNLNGNEGAEFLELCSLLNIHLEFGFQSINERELKVLKRSNDKKFIDAALNKVRKNAISHEFTLLYGIPYQTYRSFKKTIDFLRERDCEKIKAFPLNLLRGTFLWEQRQEWQFVEKSIGRYRIPVVVSCKTFTIKEWERMHNLALSLN